MSVAEAQDLVILQCGKAPLSPIAVSADTYVLALAHSLPTALVLSEMFIPTAPLVVDLKGAEQAYDLYLEAEGMTPVPVPIGEGRFVLQHFEALTDEAMNAFMGWSMTWWQEELRVGELAAEASKFKPAQA